LDQDKSNSKQLKTQDCRIEIARRLHFDCSLTGQIPLTSTYRDLCRLDFHLLI